MENKRSTVDSFLSRLGKGGFKTAYANDLPTIGENSNFNELSCMSSPSSGQACGRSGQASWIGGQQPIDGYLYLHGILSRTAGPRV